MLSGAVPWPVELAEQYRRRGYWTGETLADLAREPARLTPDAAAVVTTDRTVSYRELDSWADQLAAGLRELGVRAGDRIVVQLPNIPAFLALCLATFRLGAVPVLALPVHRRMEISYLCQHAEAVALVVADGFQGFDHRQLAREVRASVPSLRHVLVVGDPEEFVSLADIARAPVDLPAVDPDEVALLLLSGGSTGLPKLIPRTHNDYAYQLRATAAEMRFTAAGRYLAALPVAHNAALGCPGVLGALRVGAPAVLAANPSPDQVFPLIAREGVTLTTLVPSFLPLWLETAPLFGVDLSKVVIEVGGERLDPEIARKVEPVLGCTLTRWFGMAEGLLSFTRTTDPAEVRYVTDGRPLCPDDELRVVDEQDRDVRPGQVGELLTRGPYTLRGYFRSPEHNAKVFTSDGFYRTGDLVRVRSDGNMVVEGRIKEVINRGGEKVSAIEVEENLRAHPQVHDVAVVPVTDRIMGERTCAFVIPAQPATGELTLGELRRFLAERGMAEYKLPDRVVGVAQFPRTAVGKVNKVSLRARAEQNATGTGTDA